MATIMCGVCFSCKIQNKHCWKPTQSLYIVWWLRAGLCSQIDWVGISALLYSSSVILGKLLHLSASVSWSVKWENSTYFIGLLWELKELSTQNREGNTAPVTENIVLTLKCKDFEDIKEIEAK